MTEQVEQVELEQGDLKWVLRVQGAEVEDQVLTMGMMEARWRAGEIFQRYPDVSAIDLVEIYPDGHEFEHGQFTPE
jgi:hypothetical protein